MVTSPERSVGVSADLIIEIEQSMELVVLQDVVEEVSVLILGLSEAVNVVQTVQHQPHRSVGDLVLAHMIAVTTRERFVVKCWRINYKLKLASIFTFKYK